MIGRLWYMKKCVGGDNRVTVIDLGHIAENFAFALLLTDKLYIYCVHLISIEFF